MRDAIESVKRRLVQPEVQRFCKWIFIFCFFIFVPAAILYGVRFVLRWLAEADTDVIKDFSNDITMILLVFYFGALGALVSYIWMRTVTRAESDSLITVMAKLLLGSSVAVAAFLFLRSGFLISFFYPKISTSANSFVLTYHPILLISFLAGLLAPTIIRRVQSASGDRALRQKPPPTSTLVAGNSERES
jgi:hypothetical protein